MKRINYSWGSNDTGHLFELVHVDGTGDKPFIFGEGAETAEIRVNDFYIATVPVTEALWTHVMVPGTNPSRRTSERRPVVEVSWDNINDPDGFLDRLNTSRLRDDLASQAGSSTKLSFRLPTETEWEYAARGGPRWPDGFQFSGSNDIDAVAWYEANGSHKVHDVGLKLPNQLGIHDMSGNVWEWCQDSLTRDIDQIPKDGSAYLGESSDRVLRGGCNHNWAIHCTVSKRYEINHDYHDSDIGFRLVLAGVDVGARDTRV